MKNSNEKVCCGDTKFCGQCRFIELSKNDSNLTSARFTLNALGHCDFYDGPDKKVVFIKTPSSLTNKAA